MSAVPPAAPASLGPPSWGTTVPGNAWDTAPAAEPRSVTVVVTHYEQPAELARTLAALGRQTLAPHQVVVADDGSPTPPVVPPGVELVRQEDRGFRAAAARNLGAARATGDVLVFLDADTSPEPGLLARLTRLPSALPELLAVGRRRHADLAGVPTDAPLPAAAEARELAEPAWLRDAYRRSEDLLAADATSFRFVISAVLACSRWWFELLGGFDETFGGYGGEDWELAHRSWLAGGLVAHVPHAVAWHDGPDAGVAPRAVDDGLAEAVAVADRVAVPGVAWRGLLRGPVDVVASVPGDLAGTALLATVDGLLAALPTVRVLVDPAQHRALGDDPRLVSRDPGGAALLGRARVHLELHRGLRGDAAAYRELVAAVAGPGDAGTRVLGDGLASVHDLRLHRRAARWGRPGLAPTAALDVPGLDAVPADGELRAYLGQWW
ncbi:glycosyltransferase [Nocardioides sp. CPCC 205120]|uniref:glycosyltransferase n=1 Tax=Nocardioides sp. CPCC 205120 TaxID=3406462 RepID=UPI003B511C87